MEASQQQEVEYYETQIDTSQSQSQSQSYDPSSYDPQSYYASYPQHYYYPDYSTSYQTHVHPPGVSADTQSSYYGYMQPGQPVHGTGGSQSSRSTRGGGRGSSGRHERGRGRGRGKHVSPQTTNTAEASYVQGQAAPSKSTPIMAWCELCRADCNTLEILEIHKNGKKHLRNLKVFEEMQNLSKHLTVQNQPEGIVEGQAPGMADKTVQPSEETFIQDSSGGRGGLKRKMRGGRGAKWVRTQDGSRRLAEPTTPKPMVYFLCELCNVKCESQVVYESHLIGKKHLSNLKRYQGHKEVFGENIEALYPTIPNLPPTSVNPQDNQQAQVPQDAQTLASMMLSNQNLPDPQAAQAALAQLLTQHGVHDAQTLLVQLIPYLLTQAQAPVAGSGMDAPLQFEGSLVSREVGGEIKAEPQELAASNDGSEACVGVTDKPNDGPPEAVKVEAE